MVQEAGASAPVVVISVWLLHPFLFAQSKRFAVFEGWDQRTRQSEHPGSRWLRAIIRPIKAIPASMDPSALSNQIDKILRSQTFANKRQLRKLLEVLFKNINSQDMLNPDLVIGELWPEETRTKRSADVAAEMNRLRHALKSYYEGEGANDTVTISLPNRGVGAAGESRDRPWIVAEPRTDTKNGASGDLPLGSQLNGRRGTKTVAVIIALGAALSIVAYISIRVLVVHDQPKFGRMEGSALVILNAEGKELWREVFPEGFSTDWYYEKGLGTRIWFGDLEGKGRTSVLFSYLPAASPQSHSTTLICYSDRGKEKWRWTPGRDLPELQGTPATYKAQAIRFLKATEKRPPRIVVSSWHDPWWPNQIAILDPNGNTISEYWHSGALANMVLADLDGDGGEEIVATGISNGYHQATLVVLDPDRVSGASTEAARPELQIHGMGVAQERLRLLFPRSDLNRALSQFNVATEPTIGRGIIRLTVLECTSPPGCPVWYEFDNNFHLITAFAGGDEFRSAHARFYRSGKDAHPLSAEEQAAFQKVRCLVGCQSEFVPVGNLVP